MNCKLQATYYKFHELSRMDPITIVVLVISIASGIAMTISASIIIIKNGKDITDNIEEFFRSIGKMSITCGCCGAGMTEQGLDMSQA